MKITIETVPHSSQSYETCGNWRFDEDGLSIYVSELGNDDMNFLVSIHEQIEAWLCRKRNISDESVTNFDLAFEMNRPKGNTDEPGDDSKAPYRKEHLLASGIEKIMASLLDVSWLDYEQKINEL